MKKILLGVALISSFAMAERLSGRAKSKLWFRLGRSK